MGNDIDQLFTSKNLVFAVSKNMLSRHYLDSQCSCNLETLWQDSYDSHRNLSQMVMTLTYFLLSIPYLCKYNEARFMKLGVNIPTIELLKEFLYRWPWPTFQCHTVSFWKICCYLTYISAHNWAILLKLGGKIPTIGLLQPITYGWPVPAFKVTRQHF